MAEKRIITRVQNKRDTEANWNTAGQNGFTPRVGEIIIYDMGSKSDRFKVGDGTTPVHLLPFSTQSAEDVALTNHTHNYIPTSSKGANNGVAELDENGKVPSSQLPSYVDDVIEGTYVSETSFKNTSETVLTGETGKIYVDTTTNKTYRWSGTKYVEISSSLALGTTSSTAYRGDYGNIAYVHSQSEHAPSDAEKNQNAFSNIAVSGQTTIAADSATDTLTLVAGDNVTITTDATNDKVTISSKDTVYTHPSSHDASMITGLATVAKTGSYNDLSDKPSSMTPSAHNQDSSTIDAMTGYSKPSSTSAIATTDTLNAAIGKLEKALDNKSSTGHTHSVTHTPAGTVGNRSITPSGTVTSTFSGTASSHNHGFTGTTTTLSATFTPDGSIENTFTGESHGHTFEGTAVTSEKPDTTNVTTIYSITDVGTLPSATLDEGSLPTATFSAGTLPTASSTSASLTSSVENQCLTLSFTPDTHSFTAGTLPSLTFNAGSLPSLTFNAGSLPTRSSAISMPNTNHTHSVTASGNVSNTTAGGSVTSTFTGSEESISIEYTPTGTVGDKSITPEGTVASTFEGTAAEHDHDFTGTSATLTTTGA